MSIRTRVIGCLVAVLMLFVGVSLYGYFRSRDTNRRLMLVNGLFLPLSRHVVQVQTNVQSLVEDIRRFYFDADLNPESSTFSRLVRDLYPYVVGRKFVEAENLLAKEEFKEIRPMTTELAGLLQHAKKAFDDLVVSNEKTQFESNYLRLRKILTSLSQRVDSECQNITSAAQQEARDNLISSVFLSMLLVLFGVLTLLLSHHALRPLPQLIESIKKIADGDFHQSLKVRTSDKNETALLAREYNRMLEALRERDTKIRHQQQELLHSERLAAVGQLSAEVVHEIRNPLNAISLNIDWLDHELLEAQPEIRKTIESISREVQRLNEITESYLVRARVPVSEGKRTPVHELLGEITDFLRGEDTQRNIEVNTELAPAEIYVQSDRSRLKQAFLNVIKNAKEAMPRGGKLFIRTEVHENVYRIQFSDTGSGMNEVTKKKAIQPFFTTKANGTGLGLSVTKAIVEEANGALHCESSLGKGTTFTFQFPA